MGRIGKRTIAIPKGVEVKVAGGNLSVKGPKGALTLNFLDNVKIEVSGDQVVTLCADDSNKTNALQGLYNSLLKNMITGVIQGFEKELDLVGVGYRAQMQGKKLQLQLGFSHPIEVTPPAGVELEVIGGTKVKVKGADRQKVGQLAAEIRNFRPVEPYKGKGIRYVDEVVRRKAGKAAKAVGGGGK